MKGSFKKLRPYLDRNHLELFTLGLALAIVSNATGMSISFAWWLVFMVLGMAFSLWLYQNRHDDFWHLVTHPTLIGAFILGDFAGKIIGLVVRR